MKKITAIILSILFILSMFSGLAFADEEMTEEPIIEVETGAADPEIAGDNDELLMEYMELSVTSSHAPMYSAAALGNLKGINVKVYGLLKASAAKVASGEIASTVFTFSMSDLGLDGRYTAGDLGVTAIASGGQISTEATDALKAKLQEIDLDRVNTALLYDCPAEFYWYEKTAGCKMNKSFSFGAAYDNTLGEYVLYFTADSYVMFSYTVAEDFAVNNATGTYEVDGDLIGSIQTAIGRANGIITNHAGDDDYQKLLSYKNEICEAVSYNTIAGDGQYGHTYGNPWQLIWVFDNDVSTNVVCEGYSKAFQFLCDGSKFSSDKIESRLVTGTMSGGTGAGPHMWNIVTMDDGLNYLVDVTNCDEGNIGYPDNLFLVGAGTGSVTTKYSIAIPRLGTMIFSYDTDTRSTYTEAELTLAGENYTPSQVTQDSIRVDDITIYEGTYSRLEYNAEGTDHYIRYEITSLLNMTVTYEGKTYSGNPSQIADTLSRVTGTYEYPTITATQSYESPWEPGQPYQATVSFLGMESTFSVTILESPFVSMEVTDATVIKGADGYEIGYYCYSYYPTVTMTTKDGETVVSQNNNSVIRYQDATFSILKMDDQSTNHWDLGTYQATVYCGGFEKTIGVTVVESPVASIDMAPFRAYAGITSSFDKFRPFTVTFQDGTIQETDRRRVKYNGKDYYLNIKPQTSSMEWEAGKTYSVTADVLGASAEIPVEVYGIGSIEIQEENGLKLIIHQTNGETVTANVLFFERRGGYAAEDTEGRLVTDQGTFQATVHNYDTCNDVKIIIGEHESNSISSSKWMKINRLAMTVWLMYGTFDGKVTADNIDALIFDTVFLSPLTIPDTGESSVYDAALVKEKMREVFAITDDFDISLSKYYNAEKQTLEFPPGGIGGQVPEFQIISTDTEMGFIRIAASGQENDTHFVLSEDYRIRKMIRGGDTPQPHEHDWGSWTVSKPATTTSEGEETRKCRTCGEEETRAIPMIEQQFNDVKNENAWYYETVYTISQTKNVNGKALMSGYASTGNFGPADPLTRQDFAVILYRLAGEPEVPEMENPFKDTSPSGYYYTCVLWAKASGVIAGYNDGRFGVGDKITREQVATILYRFAGEYMNIDTSSAYAKGDLTKFTDGKAISSWAEEALTWATGAGVITGKDNGTRIDARGNAARAEIGAMILRFIEYMN